MDEESDNPKVRITKKRELKKKAKNKKCLTTIGWLYKDLGIGEIDVVCIVSITPETLGSTCSFSEGSGLPPAWAPSGFRFRSRWQTCPGFQILRSPTLVSTSPSSIPLYSLLSPSSDTWSRYSRLATSLPWSQARTPPLLVQGAITLWRPKYTNRLQFFGI